jgi:pimeloyl-ACP methyl ester carboxylesterase
MSEPRIEMLAVPRARLYTETRGSGPLLLCIVGGNGDAEVFSRMAALLERQFTVVSYERRGFSRSPVDGPVDDAARIAIDAEDALRVIEAHGGGPAYVLGSSSGAIVGLALLARARDAVRLLVAHEPPVVSLLPDSADWFARLDHVHATYAASGITAAIAEFGAAVGLDGMHIPPGVRAAQLPPAIAGMFARMPANQAFFLEHEVRQYPRFAPDVAALRAAARKLVFGIGADSSDVVLPGPARWLGRMVGAPVVKFAGGHVGYMTHPEAFAGELSALLVQDRRAA